MDEFYKWLHEWVESINIFNECKRQNNEKEAILDSRIFSYDEETLRYSVTLDGLKDLSNAKVCLIGDNPGALERENKVYFYYETNETMRDERRAGSKVKQTLELLAMNEIIYFNKCLISTDHTFELKAPQINDTMEFVTNFIEKISEENKQIIFVFLGKSKKFKKLFKHIKSGIIAQSICSYHPCSSKFNRYVLADSIKDKLIEKAEMFLEECDCEIIVEATDNDSDDGEDFGTSPSPVINR